MIVTPEMMALAEHEPLLAKLHPTDRSEIWRRALRAAFKRGKSLPTKNQILRLIALVWSEGLDEAEDMLLGEIEGGESGKQGELF